MDPILGAALISGGSQAAGGIIGGMFGSAGQSATNAQSLAMFQQQMQFAENQQNKAQQFNHDEAELSRGWQTHMSNSAYQRAMSDMRLAGLNPILAANLGGASTPGGASASISGASPPGSPSLGNPGEAMARGATSAGEAAKTAMATKALLTTADKDASQVKLNEASEKYTKSNTDLNAVLNTKAAQDTSTSAAQQKVAEENARNLSADTANKNLQSIIYANEGVSAFHKSREARFQADQAEKHGPGTWGALGNTMEKWWNGTKQSFHDGSITSPTDPRYWGLKGRPSPQGEGLVIDMKRK